MAPPRAPIDVAPSEEVFMTGAVNGSSHVKSTRDDDLIGTDMFRNRDWMPGGYLKGNMGSWGPHRLA